jgi:hypothetical protein
MQTLTPLYDQRAGQAYASGQSQDGQAWQVFSSSSCQHRYRAGEVDDAGRRRNLADIEKESLTRTISGLDSTQAQDALRGALQAGYSVDAVMAAQTDYMQQRREQLPQGRQIDDFDESWASAQISLRDFARTQALERIRDLDTALANSRLVSANDTHARDERERALTGLARLMGATPEMQKRIEEESQGDAERFKENMLAEVIARGNLHTGHLEGVVPGRRYG